MSAGLREFQGCGDLASSPSLSCLGAGDSSTFQEARGPVPAPPLIDDPSLSLPGSDGSWVENKSSLYHLPQFVQVMWYILRTTWEACEFGKHIPPSILWLCNCSLSLVFLPCLESQIRKHRSVKPRERHSRCWKMLDLKDVRLGLLYFPGHHLDFSSRGVGSAPSSLNRAYKAGHWLSRIVRLRTKKLEKNSPALLLTL